MKYFHCAGFPQDAENHAEDVRLVTVSQIPEAPVLGRYRVAIGHYTKTQDGVYEAKIPLPGSF